MIRKVLVAALFPILLFGQVTTPPTDHDEGEIPADGGEGVPSKGTVTIKNITITGDLTFDSGTIVWPLPDPDPDPDPEPGPNPDPENEHPVAIMSYSPVSGDFPLLVNVDGTTSTDSDGTISSYSWNWGDTTITTGSTSSHTYAAAGNYGITLTVTDNDGATSTTTPRLVQVTTAPVNQNPVASFTVDVNTGTSPLTINVDASGSYDTDGTIADPAGYVWDFDDGVPTSGTGSTDSTIFTGAGIRTITLTVTDDDTLTASTSRQVEVAAAPVNPVASFIRTPTSGNLPLLVSVDASASSDPDGTIASYDWDWGEAVTNGSGVTDSHTYLYEGTYDITLTVTDDSALTSVATLPVQIYDDGLPEYAITTDEAGYQHAVLSWTDAETWSYPWLIQRSTTPSFVDPTDLTDNQGTGTYRWLGVNANDYTDIEDLAEGTTYYYRVGVCTNLADHWSNGTTPTFQGWLYGAATTTTLAAGKKSTYDVTSYGAIADDGLNDFTAITDALNAAEAAGGGIVYLPAGTYDVWPIDADVDQEAGGQLYLPFGDSVDAFLFQIGEDNITFLGDESGGNPTTFVDLYLWNKVSAQEYLSIRDGSNNETGIRRYYVYQTSGLVQDFTLENIEFDMGAVPINSGKEPGIPKTQWDITHKLFASFATTSSWCKNVVLDNINVSNCRGETIFVGGLNHGKFFVKDSDLSITNASTFSGSFDMEVVDTIIADSANAAMEVNNKGTQTDKWTARSFDQHILVRGCTIYGLKSGGAFEGLSGDKNFAGLLLFNEENTYQSVTDTLFYDVIKAAHGPWYEYRNGFRFNCDFYDPPGTYSGAQISLMTQPKVDYNIDGGMSETLWIGDTINMSKDWIIQQIWMSSWDGVIAAGNQSPWIYQGVKFMGTGSNRTLNRFWVDGWGHSTGRQNVTFEDFTTNNVTLSDNAMWDKYPSLKIHPTYINYFVDDQTTVYAKADYGAVGNGVTDDTTAIQNAINSGADVVVVEAGTYKISSDIELAENQHFSASTADFVSDSQLFFNFQGSILNTYALQASVVRGATTVTVPASTAIVANDWVVIQDSDVPFNNSTKGTPMELAQVVSNVTGTLTLDRALEFDYEPGSVHRVTTVNNATVELGTLGNIRIDPRMARNSSFSATSDTTSLMIHSGDLVMACDNMTLTADMSYGVGTGPTTANLYVSGWSNSTFNITSYGGAKDAVRLRGCANINAIADIDSPGNRGFWLYRCTGVAQPQLIHAPAATADNIENILIDYCDDVTLNNPEVLDWKYGDGLELRGRIRNVRINNLVIEGDGLYNNRNGLNLHSGTQLHTSEIVGGSVSGAGWQTCMLRENIDSTLLQDISFIREAGSPDQFAIYMGENMNGNGDQENITIRNVTVVAKGFTGLTARDEDGAGNTLRNVTIDGLNIDYVTSVANPIFILWNSDNANISGINYTGAATNREFDVGTDNTNLTVDEPSCTLGTGGFFTY